MSYLQRLAGSVIQPREKVRPLVGSVFSANQSQQEPEDFSSASMLASPTEAAPNSMQSPESHSAQRILLSQNEVVTTSARQNMSAAANESNTPQPLSPIRQQRPAETRALRDEQATSSETNETKAPGEPAYTPLIANSPAHAAGQLPANVPPSFSPMKHEKQKAAASRAAEREPDEIQIHIGRIEVSAVPQTPAAPVTKATRKSPSLDDYLRRRDRRSV